jgi:two-component system sensor histidine kinase SenX3
LQRLATDRFHAAYLIQTVPEIAADPEGHLRKTYPHLHFQPTSTGYEVTIDPNAQAAVRAEARRRQRMFLSEGIFFLALLGGGATILIMATRRERDFKRSRELFLAGATHELKTPLASVRLYTETLDRPEIGAAEAARIRARMLEDILRLETLINQVLAISHEEHGQPGPSQVLDLARETEEVLQEMDGFLQSNQAEIDAILPTGHLVRGEKLTFSLALHNLVHNAVRYSQRPARVALKLAQQGDWHRLQVQDWGCGIPRKLQEKVFACFFSRDLGDPNFSPGAGLGLYLVQRNAQNLGGRVELKSEEGKGSTFTLVLPVHSGGRK